MDTTQTGATGPNGPSGPAGDPAGATDRAEPDRAAPGGPRVSRDEVRDLGRLRRTRSEDRMVAGVAGGIARHLDIDPTIVRVALVVLALFGGGGLVLYGAAWLLVPQDGDDDAPVALDERTRTFALLGVGGVAALMTFGGATGAFWVPWPFIAVAAVGFLLWRKSQGGSEVASAGTASSVDPVTGYPVAPPPPAPPSPSAPSVRPGKRGPLLFLPTLLLVGLAVGGLAVVDALGASLPASAYPATALVVVGAMLVLGAVWGRAGGLILLGLLALGGTAATAAAEHVDTEFGTYRATPTTAAAIDRDVSRGAGDVDLDLSRITDVSDLDGETLRIELGFGDVDVVVPDGIDVRVETEGGPGSADLFGDRVDGTDKNASELLDRPGTDDLLTLEITLGVGDITVEEAA